jgi:hypothetical protein
MEILVVMTRTVQIEGNVNLEIDTRQGLNWLCLLL